MADFAPIYDDFLDYLIEKATPGEILAFQVSAKAQERAETLLDRSSEGTLTPDESAELEHMLQMDRLVSVLKARALAASKKRELRPGCPSSPCAERSDGRCEYCRKPDGLSGYPHHADHIVAVKHNGRTELGNLAWACFQCNVNKGSDLTTFDPDTNVLVRLFNPRIQNWDEHFGFEDAVIVGKTAIGRATIRLLQMNQANQVETRSRLMQAGLW